MWVKEEKQSIKELTHLTADEAKTYKELKENKLENIFNIIPNLSDKVLNYVEKEYKICELINKSFDSKKMSPLNK